MSETEDEVKAASEKEQPEAGDASKKPAAKSGGKKGEDGGKSVGRAVGLHR